MTLIISRSATPSPTPSLSNSTKNCRDADDSPPLEDDEFQIPERRYPPLSVNDSVHIVGGKMVPAYGSSSEFVTDPEIIHVHPMKYITLDRFDESSRVVAVTRDGKHVLQQQGSHSCFPTALSMVALDRGHPPLFTEIRDTVTRTEEKEQRYMAKAKFTPVEHLLKSHKIATLEQLLSSTGPGLLHVLHPQIESHMVVLDEFSVSQQKVVFRDPFHGWQVTVKLEIFISWIGDRFIELKDL